MSEYTDRCISISEFRRNPARSASDADNGVLLVLNHNEPAFYCIQPALFHSIMERLEDDILGQLAQERLIEGELVELDLDK